MKQASNVPAQESSLLQGNAAMRRNDLATAIHKYLEALQKLPGMEKTIASNLTMARRRYRASRNAASKSRVGVCGWELSHNAAGRVYTLAMLYETFAEVEIIGCHFPGWGREVWSPIRDTAISKHSFVVEDEATFVDQALQLVAAHPYDVVHLSKPRAPNIIFGLLYKLIWDAKVLIDIDDEELAFVGADVPIHIDDYLKQHSQLPELKDLVGKDWTRLAVGLLKEFDGVTVCNTQLQQRYGGQIIPHARDEKKFKSSPELKRKSREKYGIPQDKKVVLFFGTPREHKGLIETAQAISKLKKPNVVFCIAGDFPDQSLKQKLLEVNGCDFQFLPNQSFSVVPEIVAIADCCVLLQDEKILTAKFQTPAKLSDALAMAVPVITNISSVANQLKSAQHVPVVTSEKLSEALNKVLFDKDSIEDIQAKLRQHFLENFAIEVSASKLKDAVDAIEILEKKSHQLIKLIPHELAALRALSSIERTASSSVQIISNSIPDVDVVVPVFNALEDVKRCLASLIRDTDGLKVRIIVVNDGSDDATTSWLRAYCPTKSSIHLIEHAVNSGYTKAVNTGLRFSTAPYVITQNSDTIVSEGWLKGLIKCMQSDQKIGIVGPLSNAASWQNVPDLLDEKGNFAVNELPSGMSVEKMARLVASVATYRYPRLPFANGFCFMIDRKVIDAIGYMDEENFPIGYGEENDFCIRASDKGFELAIADDVYVFHAKSKSFGHQQRKVLSEQGSQNLKKKHTPEKFKAKVDAVKKTAPLDAVRSLVKDALDEYINIDSQVDLMTMRILFILPVKGGSGGAHSVVQEVSEMRRLGMHAHIAMKHEQVDGFVKSYTDIPNSKDTFIGFDSDNLLEIAEGFDVVVGTIFNSMNLVKRIVESNPHILPAYYVQDYEPLFFEKGTNHWHQAYDSYNLVKDACLFAKTQWIIDEVKKHHHLDVHKVQPSIDHQVYKPQQRSYSDKIQIVAMIRPQTPRRGAERTMRFFERLYALVGDKIDINLFGCPDDLPEFQCLSRSFNFINHGILTRSDVTNLLGSSDLFIDLSDYQAFGRTALEAMACGCASVVPAAGGANEYAQHDQTALRVDTSNEEACFEVVYALVNDPLRLKRLQRAGLAAAARYSVHAAAVSELLVLENALLSLRKVKPRRSKHTLTIIPSPTRLGLPKGSGYVRVVLPYNFSVVRQRWKIRQSPTLPELGSSNVVLIQREAIGISLENLQNWLPKLKASGGKLVFEIDDDLMNADGLLQRHYKHDIVDAVKKAQYLASNADLVLVSTEPLAQKLVSFNKNVRIIKNALDPQLWCLDQPRVHTEGPFRRDNSGPVRIGYIGTSSHQADLAMVRDAMRIIEKKYGKQVEIEVIGAFQDHPPMFGKKVGLPKRNDYPDFVNWLLKRVHWDIGIIPLAQDEFNISKSNLKFLEYAALDMAILVSDHQIYRDVSLPEENCLVADDSVNSWVEKLSLLIEDASLRKRLSKAGRDMVVSRFTLRQIGEDIVEALSNIVV